MALGALIPGRALILCNEDPTNPTCLNVGERKMFAAFSKHNGHKEIFITGCVPITLG